MTTPTTQKRIIFVGSYMDLFNALQAARKQDERITDAINETAADDREPVDEAPWIQTALGYGDMDLGTRFVVSGGEVIELGPQENDNEIPF